MFKIEQILLFCMLRSYVMKKICILVLLSTFCLGLHSSSIDYRGNQSADYIRNFCRLGTLYGLDLINYSPASVAFLNDGFSFSINNQFLFKDYYMYYKEMKFGSDKPTYLLPSIYMAYKKNRLALFAAFTVPLGGGALNYDDSLPMGQPSEAMQLMAKSKFGKYGVTGIKSDGYLHGNSYSGAITLGSAYRLNKKLSLSLSLRYIDSWRKYKGDNNIYLEGGSLNNKKISYVGMDGEEEARGIGLIFGLNYSFNDRFNIALRYETKTKLKYEMAIKDNKTFGGLYSDGQKIRRDLPAMFSFGFNYFIIPEKLSFLSNFSLYFIESATGNTYMNYDNGYDLAFGFEYFLLSQKMILSFSYLRSNVGAKKNSFTDLEYSLDNNNLSFGCRYYFTQKSAMILGLAYSKYDRGFNKDLTIEFNKEVITLAIGFEINL